MKLDLNEAYLIFITNKRDISINGMVLIMIEKIISGGQTGADRAALDAAISWKIPHGGWVPRGRLTENGRLPNKYKLRETPSKDYSERTEKNVMDSDGTLIFSHGELKGGSKFTREMAERHKRPSLHLDLNQAGPFEAARKIHSWIDRNEIKTLNVAGSRASGDPLIYREVLKIMITLFHMELIESTLPDPEKAVPFFPETVEEAVQKIEGQLALRERSYLANLEKDDLANLVPSLGEYIRNRFGLWADNKRLLESCRSLSGGKEIDEAGALLIIIERLWYHLKETHRLRLATKAQRH